MADHLGRLEVEGLTITVSRSVNGTLLVVIDRAEERHLDEMNLPVVRVMLDGATFWSNEAQQIPGTPSDTIVSNQHRILLGAARAFSRDIATMAATPPADFTYQDERQRISDETTWFGPFSVGALLNDDGDIAISWPNLRIMADELQNVLDSHDIS